ncbi:unnamed protein product [Peronospora destructor]|uniref:Uncharacterized protein n=1 Tax=Peronospora destructor TaxID=86335 RepID=A0AAV0U322_9STRA|nr:unnamed protein product [Peronospora destructor]
MRLLYRNTWRVNSANRSFGACYDGSIVVIINPGRSPVKPCIPTLSYSTKDGTRTTSSQHTRVASEPFTLPQSSQRWLISSRKQYIVLNTPVKGCKTAEDVTVDIDMCLMLYVMRDESNGEDVHQFVYDLGLNRLEVQLKMKLYGQSLAVWSHTEVHHLRDGTMRERLKTEALHFRTNRPANHEFHSPHGGHRDGGEAILLRHRGHQT